MSQNIVYFGSEEAVRCSAVTRILPKNESGETLKSYKVRLTPVGAQDALPEESTLLEVEGSNGFTMADFGDLPDGSYSLEFIDNDTGKSNELPVDYGKDDEGAPSDWQVETRPDEGSDWAEPDPKELAYSMYYKQCEEYQKVHGVVSYVKKSAFEGYLTGLCYVQLVDFNDDGLEELLLAYYDQSSKNRSLHEGMGDCFVVEVWAYLNDHVEKVYSGEPFGTNGGGAIVRLTTVDGVRYLMEGGQYRSNLYGYNGSDFSCLRSLEMSGSNANPVYSLDGKTISADEYRSVGSQWSLAREDHQLNFDEESCIASSKTVEESMEILAEGSGLAGTGAAEPASTFADSH